MRDELDTQTADIETLTGTDAPMVNSHYQAVTAPDEALRQTGARWLGSTTPDVARQSWRTPKWLFNHFSRMAGGFDIDAAADEHNHLVPVYYSEKNSAFDQDVPKGSKIWLNPPYSDPLPWVEWAVDLSLNKGCIVYMLIPDDISTLWFRRAWDEAAEAFPLLHNGGTTKDTARSGRVRFVNAITGKEGGSNPKGSWVFILRRHRSPLKVTALDRTEIESKGDSFF